MCCGGKKAGVAQLQWRFVLWRNIWEAEIFMSDI
jgi:hypothetical protein